MVKDVNGEELNVGNKVRYATWGMFDVLPADKNRKKTDPKYVTHTEVGTVREIVSESDGSIHIHPDKYASNGVIHLCTMPRFTARPEFVEKIG